jgi:formate hydrogenlyase subunit 4
MPINTVEHKILSNRPGFPTMNWWLAVFGVLLAAVAVSVLVICLVLTLYAIWYHMEARNDLIAFTSLLLNWKVILGSLAVAGGATFKDQIRHRLAPNG